MKNTKKRLIEKWETFLECDKDIESALKFWTGVYKQSKTQDLKFTSKHVGF